MHKSVVHAEAGIFAKEARCDLLLKAEDVFWECFDLVEESWGNDGHGMVSSWDCEKRVGMLRFQLAIFRYQLDRMTAYFEVAIV